MNRARDKGTAAETAVVKHLRANGWPHAERRALAGAADKGDIAGLPGIAIEVKAVAKPSYGVWLAEAERERRNAAATIGLVIHKARGIGTGQPGRFHVVMTLDTLLQLMNTHGPPAGGGAPGAAVPPASPAAAAPAHPPG